jgi:hypothetical protein
MKALLIIIGIFYCLNNINAQFRMPHRYTIKELNEGEMRVIDDFRDVRENVTYNNELMVAAKNEALRLAQQGRLSPPIMNLLGSKNYFGYSWIFTDIKPGKDLSFFLLLFSVTYTKKYR